MTEPRDQGLGLSLLVYVGALLCGLVLIVAPILWASGAREYPNPVLPKYDITSSRPLVDQHKQVPLAVLKREELVDPTMLAALNAKTRTTQSRDTQERSARTKSRTAYAQAPDSEAAAEHRPRRSGFFFSLF